jgi:hypothetical protein
VPGSRDLRFRQLADIHAISEMKCVTKILKQKTTAGKDQ